MIGSLVNFVLNSVKTLAAGATRLYRGVIPRGLLLVRIRRKIRITTPERTEDAEIWEIGIVQNPTSEIERFGASHRPLSLVHSPKAEPATWTSTDSSAD